MQKLGCVRAALVCAALLFSVTPVLAQQASGMYIRGDLGGAFGENTTFKDTNPSAANCSLCTAAMPSSTGSSVIFGGGVGYRFSPALRADLTLDYIPSLRASGHLANSPLTGTASADIDSVVGMLNGYVDINGLLPNAFGRFQPYLTAGIGFSNNDIGTTNGTVAGLPFSLSGNTQTSFAWALGASVGYAVTSRVTIDLGYEYRDLGEVRTGTTGTVLGFTGTVTPAKADLHVHTVALGLRYAF